MRAEQDPPRGDQVERTGDPRRPFERRESARIDSLLAEVRCRPTELQDLETIA